MIEFGNTIISTPVSEILNELKAQLILNHSTYNPDIRDKGDNIMITCPSHKDGQERKPSCGILKETGIVHCFTCNYAVQFPEFISNAFGYNDFGVYGERWLKKNFATVEVEERPDINIDLARNEISHEPHSYVPEMVLDSYRYIHPYLYKRKMTDEVIEMFDLGYDKETDCITFPVRDIYGNCLFVARRSVTGKFFSYPKMAVKPLYGVYELKQYDKRPDSVSVYVTESMFNCLTLWTYGIPAIALNGTGSEQQIYDLCKLPYRSLVLALDPDSAGQHGVERIAKIAGKYKVLYKLSYKDDLDINDMSKEQFFDTPVIFV